MVSIFPLLVPSLQTKLASYALLTHRAAVLAALPVLPPGKGTGTRWASQPAPRLLQTVVHFAGQPGSPKVAQVVLRVWFEKKAALRAAVYAALVGLGYPMPWYRDITGPSPWHVPLATADVLESGKAYFFYPKGERMSGADEASAEEITLMAHLLGWSVLPLMPNETPPEAPHLHKVVGARLLLETAHEWLRRLAERIPAHLPQAAEVQAGTLPLVVDPDWLADWPVIRGQYAKVRNLLEEALGLPATPPDALLTVAALEALRMQLHHHAMRVLVCNRHRQFADDLLTRVEGLRHRQQPDFAPLAALHERTAACRATLAAGWPANADLPDLTAEQLAALLNPANAYRPLLDLVENPTALTTLDETSEDFQALEAAIPTGVLNALLLGKLERPA